MSTHQRLDGTQVIVRIRKQFTASSSQQRQLSVLKGDSIEIIRPVTHINERGDWWVGYNTRSKLRGCFPQDCVEEEDLPKLQHVIAHAHIKHQRLEEKEHRTTVSKRKPKYNQKRHQKHVPCTGPLLASSVLGNSADGGFGYLCVSLPIISITNADETSQPTLEISVSNGSASSRHSERIPLIWLKQQECHCLQQPHTFGIVPEQLITSATEAGKVAAISISITLEGDSGAISLCLFPISPLISSPKCWFERHLSMSANSKTIHARVRSAYCPGNQGTSNSLNVFINNNQAHTTHNSLDVNPQRSLPSSIAILVGNAVNLFNPSSGRTISDASVIVTVANPDAIYCEQVSNIQHVLPGMGGIRWQQTLYFDGIDDAALSTVTFHIQEPSGTVVAQSQVPLFDLLQVTCSKFTKSIPLVGTHDEQTMAVQCGQLQVAGWHINSPTFKAQLKQSDSHTNNQTPISDAVREKRGMNQSKPWSQTKQKLPKKRHVQQKQELINQDSDEQSSSNKTADDSLKAPRSPKEFHKNSNCSLPRYQEAKKASIQQQTQLGLNSIEHQAQSNLNSSTLMKQTSSTRSKFQSQQNRPYTAPVSEEHCVVLNQSEQLKQSVSNCLSHDYRGTQLIQAEPSVVVKEQQVSIPLTLRQQVSHEIERALSPKLSHLKEDAKRPDGNNVKQECSSVIHSLLGNYISRQDSKHHAQQEKENYLIRDHVGQESTRVNSARSNIIESTKSTQDPELVNEPHGSKLEHDTLRRNKDYINHTRIDDLNLESSDNTNHTRIDDLNLESSNYRVSSPQPCSQEASSSTYPNQQELHTAQVPSIQERKTTKHSQHGSTSSNHSNQNMTAATTRLGPSGEEQQLIVRGGKPSEVSTKNLESIPKPQKPSVDSFQPFQTALLKSSGGILTLAYQQLRTCTTHAGLLEVMRFPLAGKNDDDKVHLPLTDQHALCAAVSLRSATESNKIVIRKLERELWNLLNIDKFKRFIKSTTVSSSCSAKTWTKQTINKFWKQVNHIEVSKYPFTAQSVLYDVSKPFNLQLRHSLHCFTDWEVQLIAFHLALLSEEFTTKSTSKHRYVDHKDVASQPWYQGQEVGVLAKKPLDQWETEDVVLLAKALHIQTITIERMEQLALDGIGLRQLEEEDMKHELFMSESDIKVLHAARALLLQPAQIELCDSPFLNIRVLVSGSGEHVWQDNNGTVNLSTRQSKHSIIFRPGTELIKAARKLARKQEKQSNVVVVRVWCKLLEYSFTPWDLIQHTQNKTLSSPKTAVESVTKMNSSADCNTGISTPNDTFTFGTTLSSDCSSVGPLPKSRSNMDHKCTRSDPSQQLIGTSIGNVNGWRPVCTTSLQNQTTELEIAKFDLFPNSNLYHKYDEFVVKSRYWRLAFAIQLGYLESDNTFIAMKLATADIHGNQICVLTPGFKFVRNLQPLPQPVFSSHVANSKFKPSPPPTSQPILKQNFKSRSLYVVQSISNEKENKKVTKKKTVGKLKTGRKWVKRPNKNKNIAKLKLVGHEMRPTTAENKKYSPKRSPVVKSARRTTSKDKPWLSPLPNNIRSIHDTSKSGTKQQSSTLKTTSPTNKSRRNAPKHKPNNNQSTIRNKMENEPPLTSGTLQFLNSSILTLLEKQQVVEDTLEQLVKVGSDQPDTARGKEKISVSDQLPSQRSISSPSSQSTVEVLRQKAANEISDLISNFKTEIDPQQVLRDEASIALQALLKATLPSSLETTPEVVTERTQVPVLQSPIHSTRSNGEHLHTMPIKVVGFGKQTEGNLCSSSRSTLSSCSKSSTGEQSIASSSSTLPSWMSSSTSNSSSETSLLNHHSNLQQESYTSPVERHIEDIPPVHAESQRGLEPGKQIPVSPSTTSPADIEWANRVAEKYSRIQAFNEHTSIDYEWELSSESDTNSLPNRISHNKKLATKTSKKWPSNELPLSIGTQVCFLRDGVRQYGCIVRGCEHSGTYDISINDGVLEHNVFPSEIDSNKHLGNVEGSYIHQGNDDKQLEVVTYPMRPDAVQVLAESKSETEENLKDTPVLANGRNHMRIESIPEQLALFSSKVTPWHVLAILSSLDSKHTGTLPVHLCLETLAFESSISAILEAKEWALEVSDCELENQVWYEQLVLAIYVGSDQEQEANQAVLGYQLRRAGYQSRKTKVNLWEALANLDKNNQGLLPLQVAQDALRGYGVHIENNTWQLISEEKCLVHDSQLCIEEFCFVCDASTDSLHRTTSHRNLSATCWKQFVLGDQSEQMWSNSTTMERYAKSKLNRLTHVFRNDCDELFRAFASQDSGDNGTLCYTEFVRALDLAGCSLIHGTELLFPWLENALFQTIGIQTEALSRPQPGDVVLKTYVRHEQLALHVFQHEPNIRQVLTKAIVTRIVKRQQARGFKSMLAVFEDQCPSGLLELSISQFGKCITNTLQLKVASNHVPIILEVAACQTREQQQVDCIAFARYCRNVQMQDKLLKTSVEIESTATVLLRSMAIRSRVLDNNLFAIFRQQEMQLGTFTGETNVEGFLRVTSTVLGLKLTWEEVVWITTYVVNRIKHWISNDKSKTKNGDDIIAHDVMEMENKKHLKVSYEQLCGIAYVVSRTKYIDEDQLGNINELVTPEYRESLLLRIRAACQNQNSNLYMQLEEHDVNGLGVTTRKHVKVCLENYGVKLENFELESIISLVPYSVENETDVPLESLCCRILGHKENHPEHLRSVLRRMRRLLVRTRQFELPAVIQQFQSFDTELTGCISVERLCWALNSIGITCTGELIEYLVSITKTRWCDTHFTTRVQSDNSPTSSSSLVRYEDFLQAILQAGSENDSVVNDHTEHGFVAMTVTRKKLEREISKYVLSFNSAKDASDKFCDCIVQHMQKVPTWEQVKGDTQFRLGRITMESVQSVFTQQLSILNLDLLQVLQSFVNPQQDVGEDFIDGFQLCHNILHAMFPQGCVDSIYEEVARTIVKLFRENTGELYWYFTRMDHKRSGRLSLEQFRAGIEELGLRLPVDQIVAFLSNCGVEFEDKVEGLCYERFVDCLIERHCVSREELDYAYKQRFLASLARAAEVCKFSGISVDTILKSFQIEHQESGELEWNELSGALQEIGVSIPRFGDHGLGMVYRSLGIVDESMDVRFPKVSVAVVVAVIEDQINRLVER